MIELQLKLQNRIMTLSTLHTAGASSKFWSLLDFRWHESFLFLVSSAALQKRQENFEACWSVKNIWSPAGASRNFWSLLERQELLQGACTV